MHSRQALAPNQMIRARKRKFHKSSLVILNRDCDGKKTRERPRSQVIMHGVGTRTRTSLTNVSSFLLLTTISTPPNNSEHVGRLEVASAMMGCAIRAVEGVSGGLLLGPATRLKTKLTAQLLLYRQLLATRLVGGLRRVRWRWGAAGSNPIHLFQQTRNGTGTVEGKNKQTWNSEFRSEAPTVSSKLSHPQVLPLQYYKAISQAQSPSRPPANQVGRRRTPSKEKGKNVRRRWVCQDRTCGRTPRARVPRRSCPCLQAGHGLQEMERLGQMSVRRKVLFCFSFLRFQKQKTLLAGDGLGEEWEWEGEPLTCTDTRSGGSPCCMPACRPASCQKNVFSITSKVA